MRFFQKTTKNSDLVKTTQGLNLGALEAEAESTDSSSVKLAEVFEDFLRVFPQLDSEKFIIVGRKGSGKTAIAKFILHEAEEDPNVFCEFVKADELDINRIAQLSSDVDPNVQSKLLFEWIILTKLVKMIVRNNAIEENPNLVQLRKFVEKNRGFIDIDKFQVTEKDIRKGVFIEYLKRFYKVYLGKELNVREEKAPFYKLLPHLEEVVHKILHNHDTEDNEYIVIFDDLDIHFSKTDTNSLESLCSLIRMAKKVNVEIFSDRPGVKAVILIRDDMVRLLKKLGHDTAKLFDSYSVYLNWHDEDQVKNHEEKLLIKRFINRRIASGFERLKLPYQRDDPWNSLVESRTNSHGSTFKFVLDHTFYRPRDLLMVFNNISNKAYKMPICQEDLEEIILNYTIALYYELRNELNIQLAPDCVDKVFEALKAWGNGSYFCYRDFETRCKEVGLEENCSELLSTLYDYSMIGNIDTSINPYRIYFKHRERINEIRSISLEMRFVLHYALRAYYTRTLNSYSV
ncbi:hypothetical protein V511_10280 [Mesotoga sp. Brook.08.YT.4.2.5.1]|uniref:P-loop ATPase, Sll1717 family n=1 Tax=unclassified Mesotoga TaxID=1184398 RepID=UPI000C99F4E6|nr:MULTISPECIES: hypothetical protein [unclassified Mesotoga]PNE20141.1 hypothetical protein V511_10280 [Mesotoga sp. Brook.08.YT.4.2.5.1]RAO96970.1 hypothetical protein M388_12280 [Mesotoga sp. Brook.08.YT.4.2.5.4.]RDI90175.1 hypothetical protein Q502_14375 [Mesotoga sp. Brook.08.YT.4.2.5.2.]